MKSFLKKLLLFLLPMMLFAVLPVSIQVWSKEDFYNLDFFLRHAPPKSLVGYAYNEENYRYLKYKTILEDDAVQVIAIGSSRVLQFRQEMFETSFYNAGYVVETIADFQAFLSILPKEKLPRYLIIGLDQWMFNAEKDKILRPHPPTWWTRNPALNRKKTVQNFLRIYRDIVTQKIKLDEIDFAQDEIYKVGLYAALDSSGFRRDGSFFYGRQIHKLETGDSTASDYQFRETLTRVTEGKIGFEHGHHFNEKAIEEFERCLTFCQQHAIKVVCFLPPFADAVHERMIKDGHHTYVYYIEPALVECAEKYQFEFYAFENVSSCGSSDVECIDGRHGSEKTYVRLLLDMLENGSLLNDVCSRSALQKALEHAESGYTIYANF